MTRYLVEVPHEANKVACEVGVQVFLSSGNHFLANADWGCEDGEHKAWMVVEAVNKEQARSIVPFAYRPKTKVVALKQWRREELDEMVRHHGS